MVDSDTGVGSGNTAPEGRASCDSLSHFTISFANQTADLKGLRWLSLPRCLNTTMTMRTMTITIVIVIPALLKWEHTGASASPWIEGVLIQNGLKRSPLRGLRHPTSS